MKSSAWLAVFVLLSVAACQEPGAGPVSSPDGAPPDGGNAPDLGRAPNPIQQENARPGTPDWQIVQGATVDSVHYRYREIEAYADAVSVAPGQQVGVMVSTAEPFTARVYRLGFYGGAVARLLATLGPFDGNQVRPLPSRAAGTRLVDARWPVTFTVPVGMDWTTGIYVVRLTAAQSGAESYVPLVVRGPGRRAPLLLVHTANTDEAYNLWGGTNLYQDLLANDGGRATQVSFNRPFLQDYGAGQIFYWEVPALRFLEQQGYDVEYASDVDLHEDPGLAKGRAAVLVVGHSEYWSGPMRDAVEAAVASGVSLANLGGNDVFFQVRYGPSPAGASDRIIICYKDADADRMANPGIADGLITVRWRDPPLSRPEQTLLGSMFVGATQDPLLGSSQPIRVLAPQSWIFTGTAVGAAIPPEANWLGWEMDALFPAAQYAQAPGVVVLTSMGLDLPPGASSSMTLYQAPPRGEDAPAAWVWNGSAMNWAWGLSEFVPAFAEFRARYRRQSPVAQRMLQNFLARVGAAP